MCNKARRLRTWLAKPRIKRHRLHFQRRHRRVAVSVSDFRYRSWLCSACSTHKMVDSHPHPNNIKTRITKVILVLIRKRWDFSWVARSKRHYRSRHLSCPSSLCSLPAEPTEGWLKPSRFTILKPDYQRQSDFNSEKVGFEPTVQVTPHNTLAGCRLKPLGHFSNRRNLYQDYIYHIITNLFFWKAFKKNFLSCIIIL